ncbi:NUDIX hydrolase [Sediminibacterium sp.]|uniref:NUDIX hydrolase n=1 Tax=Sediminibacterium sp. TaxID=1917865 RepID=UPI0025EADDAA|nr:NUDIX hydrolase [Sediminibacterium sp.]MBT9484842.1 NUDIX hydrolase [Sediminibacterium sp.]
MQNPIKPWTVQQSTVVYAKKWMKIKEEICQLPDGQIINPYFVIDVPDFCNVVMVTTQDEIVMVEQYRHAAGIISLELPGGMIEPGEDPMLAAKREMEEETGYQSNHFELLYTIHPNPPLENNQAHFYLATQLTLTGNTSFDQYEDIKLVLVNKHDFMNKLLQNSFTHGAQVGAMFAAAVKLGWLKQ